MILAITDKSGIFSCANLITLGSHSCFYSCSVVKRTSNIHLNDRELFQSHTFLKLFSAILPDGLESSEVG